MKCFENLIKKTKTDNEQTNKKKEKHLKRVSKEIILIPIFQVLEQTQGKRAGCPGMLNIFGGWVW